MTQTYFSSNRYSKSKLERSVPLYHVFELIDDTILEACHK